MDALRTDAEFFNERYTLAAADAQRSPHLPHLIFAQPRVETLLEVFDILFHQSF
jgi:hypothetical protein